MHRFSGKTVIVTGSSSGIGATCARRFAQEGANVTLIARTREKLEAIAADLDPTPTLVCVADVFSRGDVARMVEEDVAKFSGIDVLHSNAGIAVMKSFEDTMPEDWRQTMAIDVGGPLHCARLALPHLKASKMLGDKALIAKFHERSMRCVGAWLSPRRGAHASIRTPVGHGHHR